MKNRTIILWTAIIVVATTIIMVSCGGKNTTTPASENTEETTKTTTEKEWVEIMKLTGSGDKKSDLFNYTGGKARIRYNVKGDDWSMLNVYVMKEGKRLMVDGGLPEVSIVGAEEGESSISHFKKGNYYLDILAANAKWEIVVEELK